MEDLIHILWAVYLTIKQNMTFMNKKKKIRNKLVSTTCYGPL